jgi:archaellum component FlaG (FlaF/FlaG flagellin family)
LILILGFIAGVITINTLNLGAGITSAGALVAYAMIEIEDLRIVNKKDYE